MVVLSFQDPQTGIMDEWELKFEHIDWIDISDAELSGNQEALEKLMYEKYMFKVTILISFSVIFPL